MTLRQRILKKFQLLYRHPVSLLTGLVALPLLNLMIKLHCVNARKFGLKLSPDRFKEKPYTIDMAKGMSQAINTGAKFWHLQNTSCVARSVLLWLLYQWRGIPAQVVIGDDVDNHGAFHAWVEINDQVVSETRNLTDRLKRFDAPFLS